jgi:hypothetical protein
MRNDLDIEDALKKYRHKPGSRVKRSVLTRFADRTRHRVTPGIRGLWRKPVPLYLAAAQIVIALAFGFFVAQILPFSKLGSKPPQDRPLQVEAGEQSPDTIAAKELTWEIAPNDLL